MSEQARCPTCGQPVKVVGNTTIHYEPVDEVARLQRSLDECVRSHQKQNALADGALDLLVELRGWQLEASGAPKELLDRLNTFLDSE